MAKIMYCILYVVLYLVLTYTCIAVYLNMMTITCDVSSCNMDSVVVSNILEYEVEIVSTTCLLHQMRNKGELAEEEVADKLSNLGLSATGLEHVYQYLSLPVRSKSLVLSYCHIIHG